MMGNDKADPRPGSGRQRSKTSRLYRFEGSNEVFRWSLSLQLPGGVAQLGERLPCKQEAIGSNPFISTISMGW